VSKERGASYPGKDPMRNQRTCNYDRATLKCSRDANITDQRVADLPIVVIKLELKLVAKNLQKLKAKG
jgi:hypothetical protein